LGASLPIFLSRTTAALTAQALRGTSMETHPERILVVLELSGGNDGLNTVVPHADGAYYRARPRIGIPAREVLKVTDTFGFHPSMVGFERSEEHTSELQSPCNLVCRLLLEKKNTDRLARCEQRLRLDHHPSGPALPHVVRDAIFATGQVADVGHLHPQHALDAIPHDGSLLD